MANEIERKFLVDVDNIEFKKILNTKGTKITQGYLSDEPERTVRIRTIGEEAYLTIKGKQVGISKPEYEYKIPNKDAEEMLKICKTKLIKTRYYFEQKNLCWEIDVFEDENLGLIVAEIELPSEDHKFEKPLWLKEEVSHDFKYSNSNLSKNSFKFWSK